MDIVRSTNNVPIRLPVERWIHIIENHDDLAGYYDEVLNSVEEPDYIMKGYGGALVALTQRDEGKFLVVIYKEVETDGFIITAYFSREINLEKEVLLWQKKP